jgi:hypothetical protein
MWYKSNMNVESHPQHLVFSFENMLVAYAGERLKCTFNLHPSPLQRHNVLVGPTIRSRLQDEKGNPLNPYEKPSWIARLLSRTFALPGATVLVLGCGVGGEVLGALAAGMNVVALDNDLTQLQALHGRLSQLSEEHSNASLNWEVALPEAFAGQWGAPGVGAQPVAEKAAVEEKGEEKEEIVQSASPEHLLCMFPAYPLCLACPM